jgi:uncharacterized protein (DUF433 family)
MELPDYLDRDDFGHVHLSNHRIGLNDIVYFYNEGYSPEMLAEQYPSLPLPLIHKVIAFYLENQRQVDAYVAAHDAEVARQRAVAKRGPDLAELERRRKERLKTKVE